MLLWVGWEVLLDVVSFVGEETERFEELFVEGGDVLACDLELLSKEMRTWAYSDI